ncbi:M67 family metallopeptidase [Sphingomonas sp.]|jgi:proteasome lid subunit RPN8/RPN11|uniref:M67 family metallopeptidase n=1 Tax=Sphingomonas sp. TaxID=28214 RepID=UPI002EDA5A6F
MIPTISTAALATIRADVAANEGREACGLLLAKDDDIMLAVPCRNVAADPARRFEIDPVALIAAHRAARAGGPAIVGHYHSHPDGSSLPSPRDAADAVPDGSLWLIVGADSARLWRAVPHGLIENRFDPVPCAVGAAVPEGPR